MLRAVSNAFGDLKFKRHFVPFNCFAALSIQTPSAFNSFAALSIQTPSAFNSFAALSIQTPSAFKDSSISLRSMFKMKKIII
ncbi:hypothetical protein [Fidelibacter multiformis]|uniref:hypothetical protein n=1 Tax=Fidelibacter multiformis TaxID=3377529 RepID=UPI0037DC3832